MSASTVVLTKIIPPRPGVRHVARPRLLRALRAANEHRLTLVQAGAGYGKSTLLAHLAQEHQPVAWYQVTRSDGDPLVFLLHLCYSLQRALPDLDGLPTPLLESWEGTQGPLPALEVVGRVLNALSRQLATPTLLVLDDIHLALNSPDSEVARLLDHMIGLAPPDLHFILASRVPIQLPSLPRWQARGQVLGLDQRLLAFTTAEILQLFEHGYGLPLTAEEATRLSELTEGWAIALHLVWQNLRSERAASMEEALMHSSASLDGLFEMLAQEVLGQQPADVREFLIRSATLQELTPEACDALGEISGSEAMLSYLKRRDLFVLSQADGTLRFHPIFHRFLRQQATPEQRAVWHRRAATHFQAQGDPASAVYHYLRAQDYEGAASLLATYGQRLFNQGRLDTLAAYLDRLPPDVLRAHPVLLFQLGELARMRSRFPEALGWYQQAEALWRERGQTEGVVRALRGQARVYLDTVDPSQAERLLQKVLRLSDGIEDREARARLYELLAENKLNAGKPAEAEALRKQAVALRSEGPSDSQLMFRVLLRTGRLNEARRQLARKAERERDTPVQTPRAHRETLLLLSLIDAFMGEGERAYQAALEGTRRGDALGSPYVSAVGYMRQGHALTLLPKPDRYQLSLAQFEKAVELSRELHVPRLRVEALWGICRVFGLLGDLTQAQKAVEEAISIATRAGDEWIASLARLAMGSNLMLAGRYEAAHHWLSRAHQGFQECADPFGATAAQLWRCLAWHQEGEALNLPQHLPRALHTAHARGYDFFFLRPTLLGPPDERLLVPLLILARDHGWESAYVSRLLESLGLPNICFHPGYRLRVFTLGDFRVLRGQEPIPPDGWRRFKARQLFQLLVTFHPQPLEREQILEHLWPEVPPQAAARNFKVALNAVYNALEPTRPPGHESAYIQRQDTTYRLRPGADLWLDASAFRADLDEADRLWERDPDQATRLAARALSLYQGEYLPDARYEPWATMERENLAVRFLHAGDRLCQYLLSQGQLEEVIELCGRLLRQDNCWERAYRYLMQAYARCDDFGQVARVYRRCEDTLQDELGVEPSPETRQLYRQLTAPSPSMPREQTTS